jgi:hypothetical protein
MNPLRTIGWILLIIAGLTVAARLNRTLVEDRRTYGITQADPSINAPPLVVFTTVALGGFRGIIADILWMRSSRLQYEGKYFELVQLADWITKLEPRFTDVWAYHAWNLTYNISVLFSSPEDRWRWVRHGVTLLRDEGLRYNPDEPRLLFELGWFFQHKIGGDTDDAHLFYKQAWAAEMQSLFGSGRPDFIRIAQDPVLRQTLMVDYKLDPAIMQQIERDHGPLDWRLPQAHAIYWATRSRQVGGPVDAGFADRMIYQSMTDAFRRGLLVTGEQNDRFILGPHLELLPYVLRAYETALANPASRVGAESGIRYFLREAIVLLYMYGQADQARSLMPRLQAIDPETDPAATLEQLVFAIYTGQGEQMSSDTAYASVESALYQSLIWQAMGDPEKAGGYDQLARLVWQRYMAPRMGRPDFKQRTGLPPIEDIRESARLRVVETMSGRP